MLQIDVLENGTFKSRPKLAESSSRQARLSPSQLVGDGGAVDGQGAAAASSRRRIDHSERSEPEGVLPPFRYKGPESHFCLSLEVDLEEIWPNEMGRRPIAISEENARSTSQEGRALKFPPF